MEDVITMLHKVTGHKGLLELMLCKDRQGFTPADYIKPEQTNWKSIMDRCARSLNSAFLSLPLGLSGF